MTPSAQIAGGRRVRRWSRDTIIEKIRDWNDRYGEPPCSADWNPSLARWRAQEWRIERYRDGFWPSTNAAKRPFGGSFDAAVRAAGLEPHRPGPRRRAAGEARPDFVQRSPEPPRGIGDELAEVEAHAAALERKLRAAERRIERAEQAARDARRRARRASEREGRARRARDRVQVAERRVRELVADSEARVRAAVDQAAAAARDVTDARRARQRADARAAEAEARAEAAERLAAAARAELVERASSDRDGSFSNGNGASRKGDGSSARSDVSPGDGNGALRKGDGSPARSDVSPGNGNGASRKGDGSSGNDNGASTKGDGSSSQGGSRRVDGAAWKAARDAEERAVAAERRARELALLVCGEARRLTQAELDELRSGGPSGPAVLAAALKRLAPARSGGNGPALEAALTALASAAIRWRDRL